MSKIKRLLPEDFSVFTGDEIEPIQNADKDFKVDWLINDLVRTANELSKNYILYGYEEELETTVYQIKSILDKMKVPF